MMKKLIKRFNQKFNEKCEQLDEVIERLAPLFALGVCAVNYMGGGLDKIRRSGLSGVEFFLVVLTVLAIKQSMGNISDMFNVSEKTVNNFYYIVVLILMILVFGAPIINETLFNLIVVVSTVFLQTIKMSFLIRMFRFIKSVYF